MLIGLGKDNQGRKAKENIILNGWTTPGWIPKLR
jgi:hypothetical protein